MFLSGDSKRPNGCKLSDGAGRKTSMENEADRCRPATFAAAPWLGRAVWAERDAVVLGIEDERTPAGAYHQRELRQPAGKKAPQHFWLSPLYVTEKCRWCRKLGVRVRGVEVDGILPRVVAQKLNPELIGLVEAGRLDGKGTEKTGVALQEHETNTRAAIAQACPIQVLMPVVKLVLG